MRVVFLLLFSVFLFATPLSVEKAFQTQFSPKKDGVEFSLKMGEGIHIYKKSFKVFRDNSIIKLPLPKPQKDMFGEDVYFKQLKIFIPIKSGEIKVKFQGCSDEACYAPQTRVFKFNKTIKSTKSQNEEDKITSLLKDASILKILGSFFLFGVLLSLTPCIFPMIPILSGLIVKAGNKNSFFISIVYVLSMSITYTIAGVLAGLFGGNIQIIFQNPYVIGVFSLIFVILALSMFGFFEIGLPHSIQTKLTIKSNKAGDKGGVLGVAIMGFLSALIVGPCVAPPLAGALIYISQTGDAILGGSALFIMSIGMGTPLLIMGLGAGKFIPRAGSWMMGVNKFFGVIMLGVAIWMVSRVIPENITTILWGILTIGSGLYLNPFEKIENYKHTIFKTFGFVLIVIGGSLIFKTINPTQTITLQNREQWGKIESEIELNKIVSENRDVIVDFTAKWCVACKEYEEITFQNKDVKKIFANYKLYKIDVTDNSKNDQILMKKFNLSGPPAILIFKDGKLFKKVIGYKNPESFLKVFE